MSCCGDKRRVWLAETSTPKPRIKNPEHDQHVFRIEENMVFEYIGQDPLSIRGSVTGVIYHFRFQGERVEVAYQDTYAMMAEWDLRKG